MLISVAEIANKAGIYPELAGSRVLITGVGPTCGVDVARAFAEHGCRLVLQIPEPCPETDALLQILSETALELRVHHSAVDEAESATRFTQSASKAYGGLEAVINLIQISRYDLNGAVTLEEIEQLLNDRLLAASYTTQVAANRMGLTWSNGSILNVLASSIAEIASRSGTRRHRTHGFGINDARRGRKVGRAGNSRQRRRTEGSDCTELQLSSRWHGQRTGYRGVSSVSRIRRWDAIVRARVGFRRRHTSDKAAHRSLVKNGAYIGHHAGQSCSQ